MVTPLAFRPIHLPPSLLSPTGCRPNPGGPTFRERPFSLQNRKVAIGTLRRALVTGPRHWHSQPERARKVTGCLSLPLTLPAIQFFCVLKDFCAKTTEGLAKCDISIAWFVVHQKIAWEIRIHDVAN